MAVVQLAPEHADEASRFFSGRVSRQMLDQLRAARRNAAKAPSAHSATPAAITARLS